MEISEPTLPAIRDAFHKRHEERYTDTEPHNAVEVVNVESAILGGSTNRPGSNRPHQTAPNLQSSPIAI
jgi:N-methylhydantoinase A